MKITIEIEQKTETTIEIPVPSFWKLAKEVRAILDEKTYCSAYQCMDLTIIKHRNPVEEKEEISSAYNSYTSISEEEFFSIYNDILESISLTPKLNS